MKKFHDFDDSYVPWIPLYCRLVKIVASSEIYKVSSRKFLQYCKSIYSHEMQSAKPNSFLFLPRILGNLRLDGSRDIGSGNCFCLVVIVSSSSTRTQRTFLQQCRPPVQRALVRTNSKGATNIIDWFWWMRNRGGWGRCDDLQTQYGCGDQEKSQNSSKAKIENWKLWGCFSSEDKGRSPEKKQLFFWALPELKNSCFFFSGARP